MSSGTPHEVHRDDLAGFDLVGRRLTDGRLQLGLDSKGRIYDDWPKEATFEQGSFYTYTLEHVKKNDDSTDPAARDIEWGIYA